MEQGVRTFGEWLNGVVRRHELRGSGSWSQRLAVMMEDKSDEYDSYLRRVANGKVAPGPTVAFRIRRGLRAAGLAWCGGGLALLRDRRSRSYAVLLALLDIASRDEKVHAACVEWFYATDLSEMVELRTYGTNDEKMAQGLLSHLANVTDQLDPAMKSAFDRFNKSGFRSANGLLGIAYQVMTNKWSGESASEATRCIVNLWRNDKSSGSRATEITNMFERYSQTSLVSAERHEDKKG